jgi:hypothetical protein
LLDEMILTIAPVILRSGAPLLTRRLVTPPPRVVEVRPQASGLTEMRLDLATPASEALAEPNP